MQSGPLVSCSGLRNPASAADVSAFMLSSFLRGRLPLPSLHNDLCDQPPGREGLQARMADREQRIVVLISGSGESVLALARRRWAEH